MRTGCLMAKEGERHDLARAFDAFRARLPADLVAPVPHRRLDRGDGGARGDLRRRPRAARMSRGRDGRGRIRPVRVVAANQSDRPRPGSTPAMMPGYPAT